MNNIVILAVWFSALFYLSGCDYSPGRVLIDSKNLTTGTPADLRALERDSLSAQITLNDITTTHQGSDHPTGNWQIPINVEAGETYELSIQWRYGEFLLMEETGSFTVDERTPKISLELDFTNAGYQTFDNDCDGQSNLVEIKQGSNPEIAEANSDSRCTGEPNNSIELTDSNRAYASSFHAAFGQESQNRIIERFEQPLQIRKSTILPSSYSFALYGEDSPDDRASLSLRIHDNGEKQAQVIFSRALKGFESSTAGSRCFTFPPENPTLSGCVIPYPWEDNVWYSLVFERTDSRWTASVKNLNANTEDVIGSFTANPEQRWLAPQIGVGYHDNPTAEACRDGLLPLRVHFGQAIVNSTIYSEPLQTSTDIGDCVSSTGHWNFSLRPELETPLFALEMGRPD